MIENGYVLQIYDRTSRQLITVTPALQAEYDAIMDCWRQDSGDPRTLHEFLACFCDVATGRIDETVTATSNDWAGLTLQYMDLSQAKP